MTESEHKDKKPIKRKIIKYFLIAILAIILLISTAFILFSIYKDDISRYIVLRLNDVQKGEITLEDISLKPFRYFPDVSLQLEGVKYYREKSPARPDSVQPIIDLNNIYFALDILDLIRGKLNISELSLETGRTHLIRRKDGSIDILNALGISDSAKTDELIDEEDGDFLISAKKIELVDIYILLENQRNGYRIELYITDFDASLALGGESEHIYLNTDFNIISYSSPSTEFSKNNSIQLEAELFYTDSESIFEIRKSKLAFDGAEFLLDGTVNIESGGDLDLKFSGSDKDFSFFSLVLREDALLKNRKNLKEGAVYFEGVIKGNVTEEMPFVDFTFGMRNVRLDLPVMNNSITNLNLSGYFTTGYRQDLSEASLLLENFSADLPDGSTEGTIKITNFVNPQIELDLFLKSDITGYDKIFKIDAVDNLGGVITLQEKLYGYLDRQQGRIIADTAEAEILFENVSVNFPGDISLDRINGKVKRSGDRYILNDLNIITENTDVTVNGFADNILLMLFDVESDVFADLQIVSNKFVFPEVFAFDTSAAKAFPYTINELEINVEAKTSIKKLQNFDDFPDIVFDINSMNASFDDLPDIRNLNGVLDMYEDPFSFNIKFDRLQLNSANGELNLKGIYTGAENLPLYLKTDLSINNLDLQDFLTQFEVEVDSTSPFYSQMTGSMKAAIQFSREEIEFDTFTLNDCDIEFVSKKDADTINISSMQWDFTGVDYNLDVNSNPLATLTLTGKMEFGEIATSEFVLEEPEYDISVKNGKYLVIPLKSSTFGKQGKGIFELEPWAEVPEYKLTYEVKQFDIDKFLTTFLEDSILTGNMDLSFNINMKGDDWENMLSHLNGNIHLTGSDLTLHGLDVDRLLERVARSQNFNLVDLSAVVLAGPVGLAITKGTDLASIVILSPGEKTTLPKLVSVWDMENGKLNMTDIAFTTNNHRIAAKGFIDVAKKDLDVTIAEVNKKGCIVLSQTVSGNLEDPKTGDLKVLQSLLSPVTNLWNSVIGKDCEVFYEGSVEHPK